MKLPLYQARSGQQSYDGWAVMEMTDQPEKWVAQPKYLPTCHVWPSTWTDLEYPYGWPQTTMICVVLQ